MTMLYPNAAVCALMVCALIATVLSAGAAPRDTDFRVQESPRLDFPVGRCGGHARTGVRWTAPAAAKVAVSGGVWKLRNNDAAFVSLWLNGQKVVDRRVVPPQSGSCSSRTPLSFARMVTESGQAANLLRAVEVRMGDEIVVQIEGNDYVGLDLEARPKSMSTFLCV